MGKSAVQINPDSLSFFNTDQSIDFGFVCPWFFNAALKKSSSLWAENFMQQAKKQILDAKFINVEQAWQEVDYVQ
ncbi:MAG: hypothetical protein PHP23_03300 [Desulfobacterales bacterium]|nr:hypothetical protein [Desulfobacterales bacterium]MDD4073785.1 hypothetical protein [Desulfobacterales bacterium]MDD4393875.1 hypothetical protein [Desulfobacterales bacterium]